jgi:hypothetical protein
MGFSGRSAGEHRLRTVCTPSRFDGNLAQAFRTLLGRGIGGHGRLFHSSQQGVNGRYNKKVYRGGNQEKGNRGIDEVANREKRATNLEVDGREIRLANQCGDEGGKEIFGEGGHYASESRPDDHADGKIYDVPAQYELLKSTKHDLPPRGIGRLYAEAGRQVKQQIPEQE